MKTKPKLIGVFFFKKKKEVQDGMEKSFVFFTFAICLKRK